MERIDSEEGLLRTYWKETGEDSNRLPGDDDAKEIRPSDFSMMGRSESVWAFEEFIKDHHPVTLERSNTDGSPASLEICNTDGNSSSPDYPPSSDVRQIFEPLKSDCNDDQFSVSAEGSKQSSSESTEEPQGMSGKIETQVSPLFALQCQTLPASRQRDPHEYLKDQLIQACAEARWRRSGASLEAKPTSGKLGVPGAHGSTVTNAVMSGSSQEQSDDEHLDPSVSKHMKRMHSNRESARRSRKRKQAQLETLESEVQCGRMEREALLAKLANMRKKRAEAEIYNHVLNVDVGALRMIFQHV